MLSYHSAPWWLGVAGSRDDGNGGHRGGDDFDSTIRFLFIGEHLARERVGNSGLVSNDRCNATLQPQLVNARCTFSAADR